MEITNTILKILPFATILLIFIVWLQNRRNKKLGIKKEENSSKLKQWFKTTEVYKIFVGRASLRPVSSAFFYAVFVVPASLIFIIGIAFQNMKDPISLKEMQPVEGIITKVVWIKKGKGNDYIKLKQDNGKEEVYLIILDKQLFEQLNNIKNKGDKVVVYTYRHYYINIMGTKYIQEIKYNNKFLAGYNYKNYMQNNNKVKNLFYSTWFGLKIALIGFFFIFLLNYEEKPIHRLNRLKRYKKLKNLKREIQ
jgi:hypothetical protein